MRNRGAKWDACQKANYRELTGHLEYAVEKHRQAVLRHMLALGEAYYEEDYTKRGPDGEPLVPGIPLSQQNDYIARLAHGPLPNTTPFQNPSSSSSPPVPIVTSNMAAGNFPAAANYHPWNHPSTNPSLSPTAPCIRNTGREGYTQEPPLNRSTQPALSPAAPSIQNTGRGGRNFVSPVDQPDRPVMFPVGSRPPAGFEHRCFEERSWLYSLSRARGSVDLQPTISN